METSVQKATINNLLAEWAEAMLPADIVLEAALTLSPLTGDAGFRQYFRLNTSPSLIAVSAPPDKENNPAFVSKSLAMATAGVAVPEVLAVDYQQGFMLQQDLGDELLLPLLKDNSVDALYGSAEDMLLRIQQVSPDRTVFPDYGRALLRQEMALFPQWFVGKLLGVTLNASDEQVLEQVFTLLEDSALEQPQVVVHRDYHSRNLLWQRDGRVGVIDFQDAVVGAFSYDLVSLLKDCYIRWPTALVRQRAERFLRARLEALSAGDSVDSRQLMRWFDLMGLQRHIKVLGIFARLYLRDGKAKYLDDLPLVLQYTLEVVAWYPELAAFKQWFEQRLLPLLASQHWYREPRIAGE